MAAAACWDELPDDILRCIQGRLPCPIDTVYMGACCKSWHKAVPKPAARLMVLPWLLMPLAGGPSFGCILSGGACHNLDLLPEDARGARFFGSYEGKWLFAALCGGGREGHTLLNLCTGERIPLPDFEYGLVFWAVRSTAHLGLFNIRGLPSPTLVRGPPRPVVMLAATLSSPPTVDGACVAAAILNMPRTNRWPFVCFWRLGSPVAVEGEDINTAPGTAAQDLAYLDGRFFVLTKGEHLRAYTALDEPDPLRGGDLRVVCDFYITGRDRQLQAGEPRAGYLVPSRGELLMVVKEWRRTDGAAAAVQLFVLTPVAHDNPEKTRAWTRVESLDGRLLVVGPGCSRAYERTGCDEGVYFLDDRTYYHRNSFGAYFTLRSDPGEFVFADNGRCGLPPAHPEHCFPVKPDEEGCSSSYSPPVWLLP
ncbi:hypothetical protein VPH35_081592 [Triticum aestivum]